MANIRRQNIIEYQVCDVNLAIYLRDNIFYRDCIIICFCYFCLQCGTEISIIWEERRLFEETFDYSRFSNAFYSR